MEKLKAAKLIHAELLHLKGVLVERYNECLSMLGIPATGLKEISIDGIGWSPEVAEEKNNVYYLNHGDINPQAIIISPKQKDKPIYFPFHSFDKKIMRFIFDTYQEIIADITRDSALCVDLDQYIESFDNPFDLLKYNKISIGFRLLNKLDSGKEEQQKLIDLFMKDHNFIDEDLHMKLLASAKKYGDLRKRQLHLQSLEYQAESFYTKAFGGVFVLRDSVKPVMVFESSEWHRKAIKDVNHDVLIYRIDEDALFEKLRDYFIISYNLERAIDSKRYQRIKKYFFVENLPPVNQPIKEILDNDALLKKYLTTMDSRSRNIVLGVEHFMEAKALNKQSDPRSIVDSQFLKALHKPHSSFTEEEKELVWKLLVKAIPKDPLFLYWFDKELFYKKYLSWSDSFKDWVIECILANNKK